MTFGQGLVRDRQLSDADMKKALLLLQELKSRGIAVPDGLVLPASKVEVSWRLDANGYFVKDDGVQFRPRPELEAFIKSDARFILLQSGRGGGKALSVNTHIPTSTGWKTMGDIVVGDRVFDESGELVEVMFVSDIMYGNQCYDVEFIDGTHIVADAEHLWTTLSENDRSQANRRGASGLYKTITTEQMSVDFVRQYRSPIYKYTVDVCSPIQYPEKGLLMHPYVLGAWLGDGSSRDPIITIGVNDREMVDIIGGFGYPLRNISDQFTWSFATKDKKGGEFISALRSLGVWKDKHIPSHYLQASEEQRLFLLAGLMDTDGTIGQRGHCSFDNKNYELACDVFELVSSLGMKAAIHRYEIYDFETPTWSYKVSFTPSQFVFILSRKRERQMGQSYNLKRNSRRAIVSITECDSVPVRCIEVNSPSHLYLVTHSFIPTHNTVAGAQKTILKLRAGEDGAVMNPSFENFRTSTWPELRKWIPWNMVVPKHRYRQSSDWEAIRPFTIVFMNGAKLYCKGLKDPESARGSNVNFFWYDEGRVDPTGLGWKNAIAFCRVGNKPQAWCTTTMAGLDHWTNTFFQGGNSAEVQKLMEELKERGVDQPLFEIFRTSTRNNAENLDPAFYASLVSAYPSGYLRTREIEGEASDEGGSLGDRRWFDGKDLPEYPDWAIKNVRFWDLAATEAKILRGKKINDPDETVGSLVGCDMNKDVTQRRFVLQDSFGGWWEWGKIKDYILEVAKQDGQHVEICFEQEPASGGKNQIAELTQMIKKELPGWKVSSIEAKKLGDRVLAANTWFAEATNGQWYYVKGMWNEKFFSQLDRFDGKNHDDRLTSVTGARFCIAPAQKKWSSIKFLSMDKR